MIFNVEKKILQIIGMKHVENYQLDNRVKVKSLRPLEILHLIMDVRTMSMSAEVQVSASAHTHSTVTVEL